MLIYIDSFYESNMTVTGYYEKLCIDILQSIFKNKFEKSYPKWLVNKYNTQLELDGYNDKYKLAIEYNGPYHYDKKYYETEQEFFTKVESDKIKIEKCKENNINLIVVPYMIDKSSIKDYIVSRLYDMQYYRTVKLPMDYIYIDQI